MRRRIRRKISLSRNYTIRWSTQGIVHYVHTHQRETAHIVYDALYDNGITNVELWNGDERQR